MIQRLQILASSVAEVVVLTNQVIQGGIRMSISLREAIDNTTRFEDLVPIVTSLKAEMSFLGTSYLVVDLTKPGAVAYTGDVALARISTRGREIIRETGRNTVETSHYTREEFAACHILGREVRRFYREDIYVVRWDGKTPSPLGEHFSIIQRHGIQTRIS